MLPARNSHLRQASSGACAPLLQVRGLTKRFASRGTCANAANGRTIPGIIDVNFDIMRGEVLALAGPCGSGKTTVLRCVLRLTDLDAGSVRFDGVELQGLRRSALRVRRRDLQTVFQDAYTSFDPRMSIADSLIEPLSVHGVGDRGSRRGVVEAALESVGLPVSVLGRAPRELSIGELQRVAIARAIVLRPKLLLLDEPTSGLDTLLRRQIADILARAICSCGQAALLVTHDLELVAALSDHVVVMDGGRVVEAGPTERVLQSPDHPVTRGMVSTFPR